MFMKLLAVFLAVPVLEMVVLIEVGKRIGTWPTIGLVVLTGIIGLSLARSQGFAVVTRLRRQMEMGYFPEEELIAGVVILGGALLLLTPGLITDTLGFACLLPGTRFLLVKWLRKLLAAHIHFRPIDRFDSFDGSAQ